MSTRSIAAVLTIALIPMLTTSTNSESDKEAIRRAALDYIEGWYDGDSARMERTVHPELAKRVVMPDPRSKRPRVEQMSAMTLVQYTKAKEGKKTPDGKRHSLVKILDIYGNTAMVRAEMQDWVDFMQIAKVGDEWKIVNVLWEPTPESKKKWGFPEGM